MRAALQAGGGIPSQSFSSSDVQLYPTSVLPTFVLPGIAAPWRTPEPAWEQGFGSFLTPFPSSHPCHSQTGSVYKVFVYLSLWWC